MRTSTSTSPTSLPPAFPPSQDAHEFLNYLLNQACEILEEEEKRRRGGAPLPPGTPLPSTWVHDIFQGKLVNETRCLQVRDLPWVWAGCVNETRCLQVGGLGGMLWLCAGTEVSLDFIGPQCLSSYDTVLR